MARGSGSLFERAQDVYPCKCELVHKLSLRSLLALLREMNLKFAAPHFQLTNRRRRAVSRDPSRAVRGSVSAAIAPSARNEPYWE
jgi:hypothetical protein